MGFGLAPLADLEELLGPGLLDALEQFVDLGAGGLHLCWWKAVGAACCPETQMRLLMDAEPQWWSQKTLPGEFPCWLPLLMSGSTSLECHETNGEHPPAATCPR